VAAVTNGCFFIVIVLDFCHDKVYTTKDVADPVALQRLYFSWIFVGNIATVSQLSMCIVAPNIDFA
jgi:hypothetical protein